MKRLKEYFKMIVTAVICLTMSMFPGKNREKIVKVLNGKTNTSAAASNNATQRMDNHAAFPEMKNAAEYRRYRRYIRLKKVFFWLQGPGDIKRAFYGPSG